MAKHSGKGLGDKPRVSHSLGVKSTTTWVGQVPREGQT